jgi:hypothetical protein
MMFDTLKHFFNTLIKKIDEQQDNEIREIKIRLNHLNKEYEEIRKDHQVLLYKRKYKSIPRRI